MSRLMKTVPFVVLCSLIVAVPSVWAYWSLNGVPLCTATGDQNSPAIVSDGAGGAIVTWQDNRSGNGDIYVQRVDASGAALWAANGVALCTATGAQSTPKITSDGAGGAIVTWRDFRTATEYDIYAQRVNASGAVQWTTDGVAICTAVGDRQYPQIIADGAGGAIVTWQDGRGGTNFDIYAQRVNAGGAVQWTVNGVALCTAPGIQGNPTIASDDASGAIVTWQDNRMGNFDIYAQRVNALGAVQWTANGVPLCTLASNQQHPAIASDGAGGAIVTWDGDNSYGIHAQKVNALGAVQWTANGVGLSVRTSIQLFPQITSDGAGGAFVTWQDDLSGSNWHIYVSRMLTSGAPPSEIRLCITTGNQIYPTITSDGASGAIVTWMDGRSENPGIYAQRVNASESVLWAANGIALCTATGGGGSPIIVSDGAGGAIVTWNDYRNGTNYDIYAQSMDTHGGVGSFRPTILSVKDVPNDQGGHVRITIKRSNLDDAGAPSYPVSTYDIWQRIEDPTLLALITQGNGDNAADGRIKELNGRYFVQSKELLGAETFPAGTWELVGNFSAYQQDQYIYRAGTLADSTASGIPYSIYIVSARTTTPSVWFVSDPDSGYSVDNIPPGAPTGLVAEQSYTPAGLALSWNVNAANDLSYYSVYRGTSGSFVPGPGNRVATPTEPGYFDSGWRWSSGYYYKVSAIDIHGNESLWAVLNPDAVTGGDTPKAPAATYLAQNYPNPFNPSTRITFGLKEPAAVSLRIYDAAGRLVRVLVEGTRPAGIYSELWDGMDNGRRAVASGLYFYRLDAGSFSQTRKMVLLR
jgi:predicted lipoprotein with Yx(FWY)xxD motif